MVRAVWSLVSVVHSRNSPQAVTKLTMKITTRPLRTIGTPTSQSVRHGPAPSIFAASISSCGTSWNMLRMIRTLIARLSVT